MIAAVAHIRDESLTKKYFQLWNNATKAARERLLRELNRSINYKYRAWEYVPAAIRSDIVALIKKQERDQAKATAAAYDNALKHSSINLSLPFVANKSAKPDQQPRHLKGALND